MHHLKVCFEQLFSSFPSPLGLGTPPREEHRSLHPCTQRVLWKWKETKSCQSENFGLLRCVGRLPRAIFHSLFIKVWRVGWGGLIPIRSVGLRRSQQPPPSVAGSHRLWRIDTASGLIGPSVETPSSYGQSNRSLISRGVQGGWGAYCDLSMHYDKDQDRKMKTNSPPPLQTHTSTHSGGLLLCSDEQPGVPVWKGGWWESFGSLR